MISLRSIGRKLRQVPSDDASAVARHRLIFGAAFGAAAFALIGVQVMTLSMMEGTSGYRKTASAEVPVRGRILDRKGRVLAASLPAFELYADPAEVMNPVKGAITLASLLPNTTEEKALEKLTRKGRYAELAWKVAPLSLIHI